MVFPKWGPPPLPCLVLKPRPLFALSAASGQACRLQLICRVVRLASLQYRHDTLPGSITIMFHFRIGGSGLGVPWRLPIIHIHCGQGTSGPPAFLVPPFVTIMSDFCCRSLHYPIWSLPNVFLCCSQMGSWDDHPCLKVGVPLTQELVETTWDIWTTTLTGDTEVHFLLHAGVAPGQAKRTPGLLLLLS